MSRYEYWIYFCTRTEIRHLMINNHNYPNQKDIHDSLFSSQVAERIEVKFVICFFI